MQSMRKEPAVESSPIFSAIPSEMNINRNLNELLYLSYDWTENFSDVQEINAGRLKEKSRALYKRPNDPYSDLTIRFPRLCF